MSRIFFTTPVPPSVNNYLEWKVERRGRKIIPKSYYSPDTNHFIQTTTKIIENAINEQNWETLEKNEWCRVTIKFFFERKGKDPSNYSKVLFDTMTKCNLWNDDEYVLLFEEEAYIDKNHPRLEVTVEKIDKIGVFENQEQLDLFKKENCETCTHNGKRKCSFLTQFLENRCSNIDLETMTCTQKYNF